MRLACAFGLLTGVLWAAACGRGGPASPLSEAAVRGDLPTLERLLAAGARPDERDTHGWSLLSRAARAGQVESIRMLLRAGARADDADTGGNRWTPLQHAIHKNQPAAVRALLDAGADPGGGAGSPPLWMAAGYGQVEVVRLLLDRGADPRAERVGVNALWAALGGGAVADITDGPPLGSCSIATARLLLERAPDLRVRRSLASHVVGWLAKDECRPLFARVLEPR